MALRQLLLHLGLTAEEPVQGGVELVLVGVLHAQTGGQRGVVPVASGGQLGGRLQESGHDHGHHQLALPSRSGSQHPVETGLAQAAEHGQHVAVRQAALDRELLIEGADRLAAEDCADGLDGLNGKGGEIGEGAVLDLGALAVGLADQVGRVLTATLTAGDDGYVHCAAGPNWHAPILLHCAADLTAVNGYISTSDSYSTRTRTPSGTSV